MIDIDLHYTAKEQVSPLLRVRKQLFEEGLQIHDRGNSVPQPRPGVILLLQQMLATPSVLDGPSPVLLLERADSASGWARHPIRHPNVRLVLKGGILTPRHLNNYCRARFHSSLIDPQTREPPSATLNEHDLAKLTPIYNFAVYDVMARWLHRPVCFHTPRESDIHFAGTVDYGDQAPEIRTHRLAAIRAIESIPGRHFVRQGRTISQDEYDASLLNSKICLSPWGLGEICYRDCEAMFAGCVLIKPDTDFVSTWPPLFRGGSTYIPCKADFSNLGEKVEEVLDRWDGLTEMREKNRRMMIDAWKPDVLAKHLLKKLQQGIPECVNTSS